MPLVTSAQQTKETTSDAAKNVPKTYVPGLEQFMNVILMEHNKLSFAAKARNWRLADYQLVTCIDFAWRHSGISPVVLDAPG
ncbi:MAG TPA: hypothetical protein VK877_00095 [Pseudolabrys sp.]|nr:hypothetical protein [Pseudolabrys sp.]